MYTNFTHRHLIVSKCGLGSQVFIYHYFIWLTKKFPYDAFLLDIRTVFWLDYKFHRMYELDLIIIEICFAPFYFSVINSIYLILFKFLGKKINNIFYFIPDYIEDNNSN